MASNPFDQFDQIELEARGNPFDQFDAATLPTQSAASRRSDPFAGDALLSDDSIARLVAGERSTVTPTQQPSSVRRYAKGIADAATAPVDERLLVDRVPILGPLYGASDAALTIGTGALVPFTAPMRSMVTGEPLEKSEKEVIWQPRSGSGQAQLNMLGSLVRPVSDSGAEMALMPLAAGSPVLRGPKGAPYRTPKPDPIPTTEQLTKAARGAYKAGKDSGVVVQPDGYSAALGKVRSMVTEEGIDQTLHPKSTAVMRRLEEANGKPMTLQEAETLRKIALDAEDDLNPVTREPTPDARLAAKIVDELDDSLDELSTNAPARAMYARSRRSQLLDRMIHRAEIRAGAHYTQAGMEHALRQEFKNLALNPRRMRGLTPEQRVAVEKVAKGGVLENGLRALGKFDPFGSVVSAVSSLGASSMLTGFTGNPVAMGLPVAGFFGKRAATSMTRRNVDKAREALVGRARAEMPPVAAAAPAQPAAMAGDLMPRRTLSLPSPTIIAGSRSAPGTTYAREQMGLTPDVERAGALHPGVPREVLASGAPALPYRPAPGLLGDQRPMVVDTHGRVAANTDQLQRYLRETGQNVGHTRNGRRVGLLGRQEPSGGGLLGRAAADEVATLELEASSRGLFEGVQTPDKLAAEAEWLSRYRAAQARAQKER